MEINVGVKLSQAEVMCLLNHFDDSSDIPLHVGLDFESYSKKLSDFAYFIIAEESEEQIGFIAYYLNDDDNYAYIPQVVVHKNARHNGIGHKMMIALYNVLCDKYKVLRLEVLKVNENARRFYIREGFVVMEDRNVRLLLEKVIAKENIL